MVNVRLPFVPLVGLGFDLNAELGASLIPSSTSACCHTELVKQQVGV